MNRGLLAEFSSAGALVEGVRSLRRSGYREIDAFSPYPLEEVEAALGLGRSRIPMAVLIAGIAGGVLAYFIQWWTNAVDYPLNVGGFPPHSPPTSIPITFETTVLFASFAAFLGVFAASRLPRLWDPVFEIEGFERAMVDRFFVAIDAADESFDAERSTAHLLALDPLRVIALGVER